ncbi:DUF1707 domain-containing protein [Actinomadura sp. WMMB 499]|uniref:DUF1707 SHOCT-like domain-containing protein n=1 Tax=Actinomadura sp. WMMB 499 TaxID=1219491 RepID=UPI00124535FE|nr:DUF1707 domain-containing protein [Actinomadura sp. WMMB 499]QFG22761.1 DUF1707 domain-containing protein [Actinomadura sp. WMMB 499]
MPTEPSGPPAPRASDADRDRAVDRLRDAVADGRLDPAEFDERVDAALTARTVDALAPLVADLASAPVEPAAALLTIKERHGTVRRDGRWTLPHRLALRTAWSAVTLDLTRAVRTAPELVIDLRVNGGGIELLLAPDMAVDANGLSVRHGTLDIGDDEGAPKTLHVRLAGRLRHGSLTARWPQPRAG